MRWERPDEIRVTIREDLINGAGLLSGAVTYALGSYTIYPRRKRADLPGG